MAVFHDSGSSIHTKSKILQLLSGLEAEQIEINAVIAVSPERFSRDRPLNSDPQLSEIEFLTLESDFKKPI